MFDKLVIVPFHYNVSLYELPSENIVFFYYYFLLLGARFGRRATWVGASGDQTFMRIDESLINAHILSSSKVFANQSTIGKSTNKAIHLFPVI